MSYKSWFITGSLAIGCLWLLGLFSHETYCSRGHYATVRVDAGMELRTGLSTTGELVSIPVWIPEHDEQRWFHEGHN